MVLSLMMQDQGRQNTEINKREFVNMVALSPEIGFNICQGPHKRILICS